MPNFVFGYDPSRVWRLLSKNAENRGFLRFSKSSWVEEGREFRFRGDLHSQESTFPLHGDS